jgi:hypothetical protein
MLGHTSCLAPIQYDSEQLALRLAARGTRGKGGVAGLEDSRGRHKASRAALRGRRVGRGNLVAIVIIYPACKPK